ncbi:MAG: tripartite tricarboxylate transporter substrate binding protein [Variibacter sp.]|nr:tripartite tricarboxylate transporter substrate binding protein [Variibacter sp.]
MPILNRRWCVAGAILLSLAGVSLALAQDYPTRPIRIVIGPSSDVGARLVADRLHRAMGQPVIVENRGGGGGEVAAKAVSSAEADGYTLLYATSSYTLNTALQYASYNFAQDFEPISLFGISSFTLVVHPSVPARNLQELIALAKSKPGELNCASSGLGTPAHLGCEMFNAMAGVKTVHVPFRDVASAVNAIVSGYVQMLFAVSVNAQPQIDSGVLRGIAITTEKPSRLFPKLPTINENGIPGFIVTGWGSMVAPARTPQPVIQKLNTEVQKVLKSQEAATLVNKLGMEPNGVDTPEQFRQFIRDDIDRWNRLIDVTGVKRGKP